MSFFGRIIHNLNPKLLPTIRLVKMKQKAGLCERIDKQDGRNVICSDMFKADTDLSLFLGLKVVHENSGTEGVLESAFGTEGKIRVRFPVELDVKTDHKGNVRGQDRVILYFKKYDFEQSRRIMQ